MALVRSSGGDQLVTRTSATTLTAVTAICTHEACTVTGFDGQIFVCPCHGSRYNTSGMVVSGPAPRPLRQFATQFTDNVLTITL
jgi:Rieske Fe-S protein